MKRQRSTDDEFEPEIKIVKEEIKKTKEEPKVCKYKWIVVPSCQKFKKEIHTCILLNLIP